MKNIVIIGMSSHGGGSLAGALSKTLPEEYRLVVIEKQPGAYLSLASLRASVVPGWEDKVLSPAEPLFSKTSRHAVLAGTTVTQIQTNQIVVDTDHSDRGFGFEIPFEFLVIATGSTFNFPMRLKDSHKSLEDSKAAFVALQEGVASAQDILIVGGGPVGVEFAGEVAAQYPKQKSITLVHANPVLIGKPYKDGFGQGIASILSNRFGVNVILNDSIDVQGLQSGPISKRTFTTKSGEKITADFVWIATGGRPDPSLVRQSFPKLVTDSNQIKVKSTLQIDSPNPQHSKIFALGDVASTAAQRMAYQAASQGGVVAKNIMALIKGTKLTNYNPGINMMAVSIGPYSGATHIFGVNLGQWLTAQFKSKNLLTPKFNEIFNVT